MCKIKIQKRQSQEEENRYFVIFSLTSDVTSKDDSVVRQLALYDQSGPEKDDGNMNFW